MSLRKRLDRLARLVVALALYPIAALAPRSGERWVLGHAGDRFAGNPKYLFLWLSLHRPDIRATWITGDRGVRRMLEQAGLPVAARWSPRGIAAALRARVHAFSHDPADVNAPLGRGAVHMNLWHGVGVKALHLGAKPAHGLRAWLRSFVYIPYDTVVSTSDMMQAHFAEQFRLPPERCPQLGYPRLDVASDDVLAALARSIDAAQGFRLNPGDFEEVYLYVPTFRDTGRPFLAEALPDLDALSGILAARNAVLYIKPHPRTADAIPAGYPAIRRWPDAVDIQTYLPDLAGLITDYSSVLYDYLAVRHDGAIVYAYDYDTYVGGDRALAHDFRDNIAGTLVTDFNQLCAVIASGAALVPAGAAVDIIRARFWGEPPTPASAAVVAHVETRLRRTGAPRRRAALRRLGLAEAAQR